MSGALDGDLAAMMERVMGAVRRRNESLPCAKHVDDGNHVEGVNACIRANAHADCPERRMETCPMARERQNVTAELARMVSMRIPGASSLLDDWSNRRWWAPPEHDATIAETLIARLPRRAADGTLLDAVPMLETPPLRVAMAFARRLTEDVVVDGSRVSVRASAHFLVMGGAVGVGKTCAACAAALEVPGGLFVDARELVRFGDSGARELQDRARACGLLVVDDLGTEYADAAGYATSVLVDLLTYRRDHRRRTIVTTNLRRKRGADGTDGLLERYGERLANRLSEASILVGFRGESLRGRVRL